VYMYIYMYIYVYIHTRTHDISILHVPATTMEAVQDQLRVRLGQFGLVITS
jgi:hypothetical protein